MQLGFVRRYLREQKELIEQRRLSLQVELNKSLREAELLEELLRELDRQDARTVKGRK